MLHQVRLVDAINNIRMLVVYDDGLKKPQFLYKFYKMPKLVTLNYYTKMLNHIHVTIIGYYRYTVMCTNPNTDLHGSHHISCCSIPYLALHFLPLSTDTKINNNNNHEINTSHESVKY